MLSCLATHFVGNFVTFLKQQEFSTFLVIDGGCPSVLSALQANAIIILSLEFFPPLQGSPFTLSVLLDGSMKKSQVLLAV